MRIFQKVLAIVLLFAALMPTVYVHAVSVSAEAAVLLCAETGEVLYARQAYKRMSMASTTKIMTALLTLEAAAPARTIQITPEMVAVEGTSMGLLPGDTVTLYALACGMLLSSGNDAANTAAMALGGSLSGFAEQMNARAREIGMTDTHFVTPSGLDDEAHYSTAFDMALLACEALRNVQFAKICASEKIRLSYGNPPYPRTLTNHNRLLRMYDGCIGVKTGFTKKSGRCLVSAARRDGVTLIAVTLSDPDDWQDHIALFDEGFSRVHASALDSDFSALHIPVIGGTAAEVAVACAQAPQAVLTGDGMVLRKVFLRPILWAGVEKGAIVGKAVYTCGEKHVCSVDLVAADSVPARPVRPVPQPKKSAWDRFTEKIKGFGKAVPTAGTMTIKGVF